MTAGLVENCVISGGYAGGGSNGGWGRGYGGNVYMTGGRLSRSVITNGHCATFCVGTFDDGHRSYGAGVCAEGTAIVDNCLVCANGNVAWAYGGGVYVSGSATVVNCTIVSNTTASTAIGAGVCVGSASARFVNCAIYGNGGTATTEWGGQNAESFTNCAFAASAAFSGTAPAVTNLTDEAFRDYANGDYSPAKGSVLINAGTKWGIYSEIVSLPVLDIVGSPRLIGSRIDVGCYESASGVLGLKIIVR
jgi:hypothetical protein